MLSCCGAAAHPWDQYEVEKRWRPPTVRCLIVGENPGALTSEYFYAVPKNYASDRVIVRRCLLRGLYHERLIHEATLDAFRDAGFLFDHGIRCPLSREEVKREQRAAKSYRSRCVGCASHLVPLLSQSSIVWVMGHIASNAVANATEISTAEFPKEQRLISKAPYPCELAPGSRFFLSEYLTRWTQPYAQGICEAFGRFAQSRGLSCLTLGIPPSS